MDKTKRFSQEVKERAVRLVLEIQREYPSQWSAISSVAEKIGCSPESLRRRVRQKEIDLGKRDGVSSEERARIKQLCWVHWYNHHRLMGPLGYMSPVEFEERYYRKQRASSIEQDSHNRAFGKTRAVHLGARGRDILEWKKAQGRSQNKGIGRRKPQIKGSPCHSDSGIDVAKKRMNLL